MHEGTCEILRLIEWIRSEMKHTKRYFFFSVSRVDPSQQLRICLIPPASSLQQDRGENWKSKSKKKTQWVKIKSA